MKKVSILVIAATMMLCFSCSGRVKVLNGKAIDENTIELHVQSPALQAGINKTGSALLYVSLPESYQGGGKRYPVVYLLHGYSEGPIGMVFVDSLKRFMKERSGTDREMILVSLDCANSFYVNSPVTGNWEDYIVDEVVPLIDKEFRTIAVKESRGIAGFSMGGFGSINLGLKHPDVFSAVYSFCPGLFDEEGLEDALAMWNDAIQTDYGLAFSPNVNKKKLCDLPKLDGSEEDRLVFEKWNAGFGNLKEKINNYSTKPDKLKGLRVDYSSYDYFAWIPKGCRYFLSLLDENNIDCQSTVVDSGHRLTDAVVEKRLLPFFAESLDFE